MGVWAVLAGGAIASQQPWFQHFEGQAQSLLLMLRGPVDPPDNIVILAIDEESLDQGKFFQKQPEKYSHFAPLKSWPLQRQAYGTAINHLLAAGAKAVAIDVLFVTPSAYGPADDEALQTALTQGGQQVVLAAFYEVSNVTGGELIQLLEPIYSKAPVQTGLINVPLDPDLKVRLLPNSYVEELRRNTGVTATMPSFANATLAAAKEPTSPPRGSHIFFYGPTGTFPYAPFWQVLDPENWALHQKAGTFKDKIVLIGATAISLQDIKQTPVSGAMPGIEVHANTLATLMEERAISEAVPSPLVRGLLLALALAGVGGVLGEWIRRPLPRLAGFAGSAIVWGTVGYFSLVYGSRLIPVALPIATLGLGGLTYTAIGAIGDRIEERRIRSTLERYVAPSVVEEILRQKDLSLFVGRRLRAAVLFSDIRGFSRLSFHMDPEDMVALLNTYLDAMVDAILAYRGTLDKFIGDAVMAEFGTPVSQGAKEDALNAVQAALTMRAALAELRKQLQVSGRPPLFHGIGLSYGELVSGNIGSIKRLEYTVIGDVVNVASRIEGLTKLLKTDILITADLYQLVQDHITVVDYGKHRLAGREQEAVHVYGVVGLKGTDDTLYHQVQTDLKRYLEKPVS